MYVLTFFASVSCVASSNVCLIFPAKFESEKFVDGLLGIGAAGGGKSSSSEGAMLAARLESLRKERSERAPKVATKNEVVPQSQRASTDLVSPAVPMRKPNRRNKRKKSKR